MSRTGAHPALAQLRGYWEGLRARGGLPSRSDIDPRGIERALEYAFIAERIAPGVARFRLAGMHLNDLMGMEIRGMPLTALIEPVARDEVSRQIERAFAEPAAVEIDLTSTRSIARPALTARLLLLPLHNETGDLGRILGGLVTEGGVGRAPRRFRMTASRATRCERAEPLTKAPAPAEGFAEDTGHFEPTETPPGRPHLRLIYSADD